MDKTHCDESDHLYVKMKYPHTMLRRRWPYIEVWVEYYMDKIPCYKGIHLDVGYSMDKTQYDEVGRLAFGYSMDKTPCNESDHPVVNFPTSRDTESMK